MKILIADDDPFQRELVAKFANEIWNNPELIIVKDGNDALTQLCESQFDIAILDNSGNISNNSSGLYEL